MDLGDLQRTGLHTTPGPTRTPSVAWKAAVNTTLPTNPVAASGVVLAGSMGLSFSAFDAGTGASMWQYSVDVEKHFAQGHTGKDCESGISPAISGDRVFFASCFGETTSHELRTGRRNWQVQLPGTNLGRTVVAGDKVLVATTCTYSTCGKPVRPAGLFALHRDTGRILWRFELDDPRLGAVGGGLALVTSARKEIVAVDLSTGTVRWRRTLEVLDTLIHGDTVLACTGRALVPLSLGSGVPGRPVVCACGRQVLSGHLVIVWEADYARVRAFDVRTGAVVWSKSGVYNPNDAGLSIAEGAVFVNSTGALLALDVLTGKARWRFAYPTAPPNGRPLPHQGFVYLTTRDSLLWALR